MNKRKKTYTIWPSPRSLTQANNDIGAESQEGSLISSVENIWTFVDCCHHQLASQIFIRLWFLSNWSGPDTKKVMRWDSEEESRDHDEAKHHDNHVVVFPAMTAVNYF